jgi:hypothetical protein
MLSQGLLLLGAASVGIIHMSAPDHWATLIMQGRISKWNQTRLMGVGIMTAAGHVTLSILLGFVIVGLGLYFSQQVTFYVTEGTGAIMVVGGLAYGMKELMYRGSEDYDQETQ